MKSGMSGAASALVFALALAACGQNTQSQTAPNNAAPASEAPPPVLPPVSASDFAAKVAMSDMFEIQASQLAVRRVGDAGIRSFAQTMVHDHTATSNELKGIVAGHADLALPTTLDQSHQDMLNDLTNASAADFDQKYVDQQTHAHEDAEHLLSDYAQNGENAELKGFAAETAPKVQHHLEMVRTLDHTGADEPPATHN